MHPVRVLPGFPDLHRLFDRSRDKLHAMTLPFSLDRELYSSDRSLFECVIDPANECTIRLRGRCFAVLDAPCQQTAWSHLELDDFENAGTDRTVFEHIVRWYRSCKDIALPALTTRGDAATAAIFHDLLICKTEVMHDETVGNEQLLDELLKTWPAAERTAVRP